MNGGLTVTNPVLVAAFRAALMHQGLVALLILATLAISWASIREWRPQLATAGRTTSRAALPAEPAGRTLLRTGFGLLWVFDGILQAQPAMVAGLPSKVLAPAATTSPGWVRHLVSWAGSGWTYHPIQASAAAVWIQVGIGVWLLTAKRGTASRLAGLASAGWGLLVWAFGEAFGGVFAPGLTALFGAPGAVVFYCAAGLLVALPQRHWQSAVIGRWLVSGLGLFFAGMAVLQAWPGRGFWEGTAHGQPGTLTGMVATMSGTPQPVVLGRWVTDFASFTARHGFGVNLFAVVVLAVIGAGLVAGAVFAARAGRRWRWLLLPSVIVLTLFCAADWALVEDFGFFGGLGTDPNSMIPIWLLAISSYLAIVRVPEPVPEPVPVPVPVPVKVPEPVPVPESAPTQPAPVPASRASGPRWLEQVRPGRLASAFASAGAQGVLACWAAAVVLLGAAPMAMAQADPNADPIIARAIDGASAPLDVAAAGFRLTDQNGRAVSLASLHGKVVLMTFLDPVCTDDCPLIAQEFRAADQMLGARSSAVTMVAVVANPLYYTEPYVRAFDRQERLTGLRNWLYLTGSLTQLRHVWLNYGITAAVAPGGQMIAHDDVAFVIDRNGRIRTELNLYPGPGTASSKSSFAVELSQAAEQAIADGRASD